jgi:hypothetical protein
LIGKMTDSTTDRYSAGEQGLGYIYQARLALLHLLQLPEDTAVFLEKDDDLDFIDGDGGKALASLKHKAVGDRLTDLYNWGEFETGKIESLRIRARVTEPYVLRGSFHILADTKPEPRVYWHPRFLERLGKVLGVAK